jgi:hypothetical protein
MKTMLVMLAVAATTSVFAQQLQKPAPTPVAAPPPAPMLVKQEKAQIPAPHAIVTPLILKGTVVHKKIEHVEGMSSRPWSQSVGWYPGESAFPGPELRDPSMPVISVGWALRQ